MFHIGHLNILCRAKEQCETLIVGVTTDELCYKRKQKYPIINEQERMAIVEAIRYVDKVVPQVDMEKVRSVKELGADVVFVGSDWKGTDAWNQYEKEFAEVGCTVVTGAGLPEQDQLGRVFRDHGSAQGRYSWDPMLAYMACQQDEAAAGYRRVVGWASVDGESGCNSFALDPDGRHGFVVKLRPDDEYAHAIDKILMEAAKAALDRREDQ